MIDDIRSWSLNVCF